MTENANRHAQSTGLLHLLVVYVVWGSTYLAIRVAVRDGAGFPPFALGALRLVTAGSALLAWGAWKKSRLRLTRREIVTLAAAGLLLWPCANGLVNLAEQRVDSGYAALLVATVPIWTALLDALADRRSPGWRFLISLAAGFAGVGLLSVPRLLSAGPADALSVSLLLVAPVTWALGSVLQARRPVGTTPVVSAAYVQLFGALGFTVFSLAAREPWPSPTPAAWAAWSYLVVAGSIAAFTSFVRALRLLPTGIVMTYAYVNPVIAVLLGALILGERISPLAVGGMALVLVGVWGVLRSRRQGPQKRRSPDDVLRAG
ncbi:MAG: EamA family transporter [Candidatus Bipolaricaulia bacterium]